ncbi:MAG TPA: hypothetical protein VE982_01010 [Gaiellaceae bacterium]|nr:hypothetical protein [Gaiellaceae bacterium]
MSEPQPDYEKLAEQIAQLAVDDVLVGTASTLASIAYAKLGAGDREHARRAIDALATIVPLVEDEAVKRDLTAALANVQVAFASRV